MQELSIEYFFCNYTHRTLLGDELLTQAHMLALQYFRYLAISVKPQEAVAWRGVHPSLSHTSTSASSSTRNSTMSKLSSMQACKQRRYMCIVYITNDYALLLSVSYPPSGNGQMGQLSRTEVTWQSSHTFKQWPCFSNFTPLPLSTFTNGKGYSHS